MAIVDGGLAAEIQTRCPAARKLLEKVIRLYPKAPHAFAAQSRISLMDAETRMQSIRTKLKLP